MPKPTREDIVSAYCGPCDTAAALGITAVMEVINREWDADEAERERGRSALALIETYGSRHKAICACSAYIPSPCDCGLVPAWEALRSDEPRQQVSSVLSPAMCGLTGEEAYALVRHVADFSIGWFTDLSKAEAQRLHNAAYRALDTIGAVPCEPPEAYRHRSVPDHTDAAGNQWLGCTMDFSGGGIGESEGGHAAAQPYVEDEEVQRENEHQRMRRVGYYKAMIDGGFGAHESAEQAARAYPLKRRVPKVIEDPHRDGEWAAVDGGSYLKDEERGNVCLACFAPLVLTFPEDEDGPLRPPKSA